MSLGFECSRQLMMPLMALTKVKGKGIAEVRRQYIYRVVCESPSNYIIIMKILRISMHSDLTVHKMNSIYLCCCVVGTESRMTVLQFLSRVVTAAGDEGRRIQVLTTARRSVDGTLDVTARNAAVDDVTTPPRAAGPSAKKRQTYG